MGSFFEFFFLPPDECGIVAQVSAPLAQAGISTYYICTYHTDHTLVRSTSQDFEILPVISGTNVHH
jgi:hypothetical protein